MVYAFLFLYIPGPAVPFLCIFLLSPSMFLLQCLHIHLLFLYFVSIFLSVLPCIFVSFLAPPICPRQIFLSSLVSLLFLILFVFLPSPTCGPMLRLVLSVFYMLLRYFSIGC